MRDWPCTPRETLGRARAIGRAAGLRHVYEANMPGESFEDTECGVCGAVVMRRYGHRVVENRIRAGCCPSCGGPVDGVAMDGPARLAHRAGWLELV